MYRGQQTEQQRGGLDDEKLEYMEQADNATKLAANNRRAHQPHSRLCMPPATTMASPVM